MRCFVDSNVWLYALMSAEDDPRSEAARALLSSTDHEFILSTQVINEVCVNLLRKVGMSEDFVRELTVSFFRRYQVVLLDEPTMLDAADMRVRYSLSYWDSLIVAAAIAGGADVLLSEDMTHELIISGKTTIRNPFVAS